MVAGCSAKISKMLLFIFNFAVWLVSIALIVVGSIVVANREDYDVAFGASTNTILVASATIIAAGSLIFLLSFAGCCGAIKESSCLLKTYAAVLIILVILEIVGGILALVFRSEIETILLDSTLEQVTDEYGLDDDVTIFYNNIQTASKCCGATGYMDYLDSAFRDEIENLGKFVPLSCCVITDDTTTAGCDDANDANTDIDDVTLIHTRGCTQLLVDTVEENLLWIGLAALCLVVFEIIAVIFSCCVVSGIDNGEYA